MRGMGNMQGMMKQVQKMQKEMVQAQEQLNETVSVVADGHKNIVDVIIKEEVVDPDDVEMIQDLVLAATNDALKKVDELVSSKMGKFTQGMNLPGMF